ncbi:zinc finger CCCH domain-containing protein 6-like [Dorcoceras hygrometricum]|uniref:Zinc finger CCCH domain-containing protein 6-like n=1 Tax=Dorcoceras hygrometricum TaxID=472368 RepID=A0A2Z7BXD2_9LAMI|nr:zinc finger CCCH domain-containing protein 6-like [Dorcoceras hygrometricum]
MKDEFRLLNDILAKAVTVKADSFDVVTVERFQMMTAIHYGLKVNWGKVLFNVLKDMVDKSQRKAKGFAAQIGVLLKGIPAVTLGEGVPFPFAKILSMKTVNTYIATNTTIDARGEQGMIGEATVKIKSKSTKQSSFADNTPVKVISEVSGSRKRVATEDIASVIRTKRRTLKTKHSSSQESLDIMPVAQDVVPIQELVKDTDNAAAKTTDEVDIIIEQVLEETLMLGVNEEEHGGQGVDDTMFTEDFAQWLDDFVSRNSAPDIAGAKTITEVAGSTSPVVVKDMNRVIEQGPNFLKSGWHLSLFLNQKKMPKPAIEDIFALHVSLVEPVQYWEAPPYLIKTWQWAQVCADIVRYSMFGCLKPVRVLPCSDITVYNLGVERIPADFLSMFAQGMACHSFVDSVVQKDSGDLQEVDNGRSDYVQSPASSPATYQPQESSSSSTDVSMHFDFTEVPLNAQADTQASAPVDFTMFTDALEDLRCNDPHFLDGIIISFGFQLNEIKSYKLWRMDRY